VGLLVVVGKETAGSLGLLKVLGSVVGSSELLPDRTLAFLYKD
jgi:hypothetical protein